MSNVLDDTKQQQIQALGRLGWTLSRIQDATGIRRGSREGRARPRRANVSLSPPLPGTPPPVPLTLRQIDPLIRQLTLYRDLIDRWTGDSP